MNKVNHSSSSKVNESKAEQELKEIKITGYGATVTVVNNALQNICNHQLPATHQLLADFSFHSEQVFIQLNTKSEKFLLLPTQSHKITASSRVRQGRVITESAPMLWEEVAQMLSISRKVCITHTDFSQVQVSLRFKIKNISSQPCRPVFHWQVSLPHCIPITNDPKNGVQVRCQEGKLPRNLYQHNQTLFFSLNSEYLYTPNNRLLIINYQDGKAEFSQQQNNYRNINISFSTDLKTQEEKEIIINLSYRILLPNEISNTVFLVACPDYQNAHWQGALAAAMSWVDQLETFRSNTYHGNNFHRFAPFLWFDSQVPLPDQILRFLHNMPSLQRIIVFGEVLPHDLENLLTTLLDRGLEQFLRLHIFTCDEYYSDKVNILRGNIQARMLIADESSERVRHLEEIISVSFISNPNLLPLELRKFMEEVAKRDVFLPIYSTQNEDAFLVPTHPAAEAKFLAVTCVPMARYFAAPVLLWSNDTEHDTLRYLKARKTKRIFIVGRLSQADETIIKTSLELETEDSKKLSITLIHIPYQNPVSAAAVIARLFKAHQLFDWLKCTLSQEREQNIDKLDKPVTNITYDYVKTISKRPWARHLVPLLEKILDNKAASDDLLVYQDIFIGCREFITSFKDYFLKAAEEKSNLLGILAPIWNDMVVLCDFCQDGSASLNIFPAACFAAYHEAPLLLFPSISEAKESFLNKQIKAFEEEFFSNIFRTPLQEKSSTNSQDTVSINLPPTTTRKIVAVQRVKELFIKAEDIASIVFTSDILTVLESIKPLTIALYSTDVKVPYEAISGPDGPIFSKYVVGRLTGIDAYDTSLITAYSMLYAHNLQRQEYLNTLFCLADLPSLEKLDLKKEEQLIRESLENERFKIELLDKTEDLTKEKLIEKLGGIVHIFHYAGHGFENVQQPQRSGITLWDLESENYTSLNSLEIKYRVKLGAHPLVFINSCFSSGNNRIQSSEGEKKLSDINDNIENKNNRTNSMTSEAGQQIMGVSSSFLHIGAAAVMAPPWQIYDSSAILYAYHWYRYLQQGCSIGEAALLSKIDSLSDMYDLKTIDYNVANYLIYGNPGLRLYPFQRLIEEYPETALRLMRLKNIT